MKRISRPQVARIRRILALIRHGMGTGVYPNALIFCRELGVSRPTVMRDLDFLRDEERAPIQYAPERHGYLLSDETWQLPPVELSRSEVFSFAIARMRSLRPTGTIFETPSSLDPEQHLAASFGIIRGDKPIKVRLLFSAGVAAYVRERIWHPSQEMTDRRDGSVELRIETAGWKEVVRWVLSWQPDCRVLSPRRLRERVQEKMRAGMAAQRLAGG